MKRSQGLGYDYPPKDSAFLPDTLSEISCVDSTDSGDHVFFHPIGEGPD